VYYIISDGRIIESLESCPTEHTLKELADECHLHSLWVIEGQHSGIEWYRAEPANAATRDYFKRHPLSNDELPF
jgi:hypothetical protein